MKFTGFTRGGLAVLAVAFLAACSDSPTEVDEVTTSLQDRRSLDRHVFVLTREDAPSLELIREIEIRGGAIERSLDEFGVLTVLGLNDGDAAELAGFGEVEAVDRDMIVQWIPSVDESALQVIEGPSAESDQSSAFFFNRGMQWNITQTEADDAWFASGQGEGQVVAVLDTGVDPFHIDMAGKIDPNSISVLSPSSSPCGPQDENTVFDLNFHGTFTSGMVTTNGLGSASIAPDATILGVKVLNCSGSGSFGDMIGGMAYAYYNGADVINMSLGAYFSQSLPGADALINAIQRMASFISMQGVTLVASAGNDGADLDNDGDFIHIPSELDDILSVGATAPIAQMNFDMLASYTNFGLSGVDIMAPGGDLVAGGICGFAPNYRCDLVLSTFSSFIAPGPNFYVLSAGTSFASPMVAGAAAVLGSTAGTISGGGDLADNVGICLLAGADDLGAPGPDPMYSHGRLNMMGALACENWWEVSSE